jgi:AP-3 complex subunit delta-1
MRLASEAVASQQTESADDTYAEPPLLLTQAIPALFSGMELNPVAAAALRKVPQPEELDLDSPINSSLQMLLAQAEYDTEYDYSNNEVYHFYHDRATSVPVVQQKAAADLLNDPPSSRGASYQDAEDETLTPEAIERKKAERRERYRDDPYYIDSDRASGISTPMHSILRAANGEELDVDAIPVLELQLDPKDIASNPKSRSQASKSSRKQPKRHFEIAGDETLDDNDSDIPSSGKNNPNTSSLKPQSLLPPSRTKKSLLEVDSSGLSALSLTHDDSSSNSGPLHPLEIERRQAEDAAMAQALKEVERLRLQMQRAQERVGGDDDDNLATTVVKRKKPKKKKAPETDDRAAEQGAGTEEKKKKKKKKKPLEDAPMATEPAAAAAAPETESTAAAVEAKPKKKKKRQVVFDE